MTGAQLRVEALGWEVQEECNALLGGMSFKLLDSFRELFSDASVAIGCISVGLAPVTTEQTSSMLQQDPGLSLSSRSNISKAQAKKQLFHWVTQADYRLDYLEAMVPGSKAALAHHFGQIPSSLLQLSDSDFLERLGALRESTSASRLLGQHPANYAAHPMRDGGPGTRSYRECPGWKASDGYWNRRRRCVTVPSHRATFKRQKCPGTHETYLDNMFSSPVVMDGCSSPVPIAFKDTVTPSCYGHDACYNCNHVWGQQRCDYTFWRSLKDECDRNLPWGIRETCTGQAHIMWAAVIVAGGMHGDKAPGWCDNGCARDVSQFGRTHISQIRRWF